MMYYSKFWSKYRRLFDIILLICFFSIAVDSVPISSVHAGFTYINFSTEIEDLEKNFLIRSLTQTEIEQLQIIREERGQAVPQRYSLQNDLDQWTNTGLNRDQILKLFLLKMPEKEVATFTHAWNNLPFEQLLSTCTQQNPSLKLLTQIRLRHPTISWEQALKSLQNPHTPFQPYDREDALYDYLSETINTCRKKSEYIHENRCFCPASGGFNEYNCDSITQIKKECRGESVEIVGDRCYCSSTETYDRSPFKTLSNSVAGFVRACEAKYYESFISTVRDSIETARSGVLPPDTCENFNSGTDPRQFNEELNHKMKGRSVEVFKSVTDPDSGTVYYIRRRAGKDWTDRSDVPGEQLDSRQGAWAMGPAGEFFGTRMVSPEVVTNPDMKKVHDSIRKFNQNVPPSEAIKVTFYSAPEGQVTSRAFLKHSVDEWGIPIAPEGYYFHHDVNNHVWGSLVIPSHYWEHAARISKCILQLSEFIESDPEYGQLPFFKDKIQSIIENRVSEIDLSTARLTVLLAEGGTIGYPARFSRSVFGGGDVYESLLKEGKNAKDFLQREFRYSRPQIQSYFDRALKDFFGRNHQECETTLNLSHFEEEMKARYAFIQSTVAKIGHSGRL